MQFGSENHTICTCIIILNRKNATSLATVLGIASASGHFEKSSTSVIMYRFPDLLFVNGPMRSIPTYKVGQYITCMYCSIY